jgi:type II secretory pathway predicted ATPase ExeA
MAYRARRLLLDTLEISLSDLQAETGRSRTTWSRMLNARLDPEPEGARAEVEALLEGRGVAVPRDLWELEREATPESNPEPPTSAQEGIAMRGQSLIEDARVHFRLFRNPFDPDALVGEDGTDHLADLYLPTAHRFAEARLLQALTGAGFVAMYGEPGSGKSTLIKRALRGAAERKPLVVVTPANVERRKMTAMHLGAEIIRQLSEESVPRTANVRDAVATQVLRQRYQQGQRVALVIDEAHELPMSTLKDLKRFHELDDSYLRLLAIVLVGQSELAQRFELERNHQLREVIIRCQLIHLPPMRGVEQVRGYMMTRFGWVGAVLDDVWEREAVDELARRLGEHDQQLPVLIGNVATAAMNVAWNRGNPQVTVDEVIDVWSATPAQLREWGL